VCVCVCVNIKLVEREREREREMSGEWVFRTGTIDLPYLINCFKPSSLANCSTPWDNPIKTKLVINSSTVNYLNFDHSNTVVNLTYDAQSSSLKQIYYFFKTKVFYRIDSS